jgi:hypothetical protein
MSVVIDYDLIYRAYINFWYWKNISEKLATAFLTAIFLKWYPLYDFKTVA